jgi:hypothetical protein
MVLVLAETCGCSKVAADSMAEDFKKLRREDLEVMTESPIEEELNRSSLPKRNHLHEEGRQKTAVAAGGGSAMLRWAPWVAGPETEAWMILLGRDGLV